MDTMSKRLRVGRSSHGLALALLFLSGGCAVYNNSCPVAEPEVWGRSNVELDIRRQFVRQCEAPVGNLVTDAMLDYDYDLRDEQGESIIPRVALINAGAIRDEVSCSAAGSESRLSIPPGPVTDQDIFQMLPFNDTIVVATMTGAQLRDVLEWGVSSLDLPGEAGRQGHFLQVGGEGGIRITVDCQGSAQTLDAERRNIVEHGSRIVAVTLAGMPLEPAGVYHVAVLDFMAGKDDDLGVPNDGFVALQQEGIKLLDTHVPLTEVVRVWLGRSPAGVSPTVEGRLAYQQCAVTCGD